MNCKPGDLAVVVGGDLPEDIPTLGRVVRVTEIDPDWHETVWCYEGPLLQDADGIDIEALADKFLRPIRNNDGQDETLTWKALPTSDRIAAMRKAMKKENV